MQEKEETRQAPRVAKAFDQQGVSTNALTEKFHLSLNKDEGHLQFRRCPNKVAGHFSFHRLPTEAAGKAPSLDLVGPSESAVDSVAQNANAFLWVVRR